LEFWELKLLASMIHLVLRHRQLSWFEAKAVVSQRDTFWFEAKTVISQCDAFCFEAKTVVSQCDALCSEANTVISQCDALCSEAQTVISQCDAFYLLNSGCDIFYMESKVVISQCVTFCMQIISFLSGVLEDGNSWTESLQREDFLALPCFALPCCMKPFLASAVVMSHHPWYRSLGGLCWLFPCQFTAFLHACCILPSLLSPDCSGGRTGALTFYLTHHYVWL